MTRMAKAVKRHKASKFQVVMSKVRAYTDRRVRVGEA